MNGLRIISDFSQHEVIDQPESIPLVLAEADVLHDGLVCSFSLPGWKFQTCSSVCSFSRVLAETGQRYVETCSYMA